MTSKISVCLLSSCRLCSIKGSLVLVVTPDNATQPASVVDRMDMKRKKVCVYECVCLSVFLPIILYGYDGRRLKGLNLYVCVHVCVCLSVCLSFCMYSYDDRRSKMLNLHVSVCLSGCTLMMAEGQNG